MDTGRAAGVERTALCKGSLSMPAQVTIRRSEIAEHNPYTASSGTAFKKTDRQYQLRDRTA